MQTLTQMRSQHGAMRGAGTVEEMLYTHKSLKLPHRQSGDRHMYYIKSHNLDIFTILLVSIAFGIYTVAYASQKAFCYIQAEFYKQRKTKTL